MNKIKEWFSTRWPEIRSIIWRFVRGAFAAAVAQTVLLVCGTTLDNLDLLQCAIAIRTKWEDPKIAMQIISISLASGFLLALGKAIRDELNKQLQTTKDIAEKPSTIKLLFSRYLPL